MTAARSGRQRPRRRSRSRSQQRSCMRCFLRASRVWCRIARCLCVLRTPGACHCHQRASAARQL
eukprot:7767990-Alexandrium_andersonii.AAC.1